MAVTREATAVNEMFCRARIPPGGVVIVHSAFRSLGRRGHRAEAFVEALLERLGHGTLLMPTMTWRTVTPEAPVFDELETPSHTGVLTEVFRTQFAAARSLHPTHSVAGVGPAVGSLLAGHDLDHTPCSPNSPFGKLADHGAHVLLLGIGLECCTLIHHAEETIAPEIYLRPPGETETYACRDRRGTTRAVRLRRHRRLPRNFPRYEKPLEARDRLVTGEVAGTSWRAFKARDLQDQVLESLRHDTDATMAA